MILLFGGSGYTGRFVAEKLVSSGESVTCVVRPTSDARALRQLGVRIVEGDLDRKDGAVETVAVAEGVVSAAHIRFAPSIVEACTRAGIRRAIFFGSTWRFSKFRTPEVDAVTAGEEAVENSGLAWTLLRPTMIYGPGDDRNISRLRTYLTRARVFPVFGSGEQLVQPVYVADAAEAAVSSLRTDAAERKAYEIAGGDALPYTRMIDTLCEALGRTVVKVYVPGLVALPIVKVYEAVARSPLVTVDQVRRMGEDRAFDTSAARADLGFTPRTFEEGVKEAMRLSDEGLG